MKAKLKWSFVMFLQMNYCIVGGQESIDKSEHLSISENSDPLSFHSI